MNQQLCRIVSSDYLDKDVYLNIRAFYRASGYRLITSAVSGDRGADLLVVLRGDNGTEFQDFCGDIHVYDYVKEYVVDWGSRYPKADHITVVSLAASSLVSAVGSQDLGEAARITRLDAYLPVIPALWSCRWRFKRLQPIHVSNFKRMGSDPYQLDLLSLIRAGTIAAYGGHWDLVGVRTHPLSYRQANHVLAASVSCFGLMWPYQRGRTLSGRMWQAPLNGCFVLSERGTDILGCPGVLERDAFDLSSANLEFSVQACRQLAHDAAAFWESHTRSLAAGLGLNPALSLVGRGLWPEKVRLLIWDFEFRWQRLGHHIRLFTAPPIHFVRRCLARLARRCGLHPRQLAARRSRS